MNADVNPNSNNAEDTVRNLAATTLIIGFGMAISGCNQDLLTDSNAFRAEESSTGVLSKKPSALAESTIEYVFVGHLGIFDSEGRRLVWDGQISGDIEGEAKWWFYAGAGPPNRPSQAHAKFYAARWEIWVAGELVLAGESSGTTARPDVEGFDGIWRGEGVVTEANGAYADWMGRHMFEGGNVNWDFPYSGAGIFRIN
jgi:hypothetical protein